eukprot:Nk52_evm51s62 gene=Nk52_evmTU51s62
MTKGGEAAGNETEGARRHSGKGGGGSASSSSFFSLVERFCEALLLCDKTCEVMQLLEGIERDYERKEIKKVVNIPNREGLYPLHWICARAETETKLVEWVLRYDSKLNRSCKSKARSGWSPLHYAFDCGNLEAASCLVEHGADMFRPCEGPAGLGKGDRDEQRRRLYVDGLPVSVLKETIRRRFQAQGQEPPAFPQFISCVYSWGSNSNFAIGHPSDSTYASAEEVVLPHETEKEIIPFGRANVPARDIAPGGVATQKYHSVVIVGGEDDNGTVYSCGHGLGGRLGHGDCQSRLMFTPVKACKGLKIVKVALGKDHTLFLSATGKVYSCGSNASGQLGRPDVSTFVTSPQVIELEIEVRDIAAGDLHSVMMGNNMMYICGKNEGQMGFDKGKGKDEFVWSPRMVSQVSERLGGLKRVSASNTTTVCMTDRGLVLVFKKFTCLKLRDLVNVASVAHFVPPSYYAQGRLSCCGDVFGIFEYPDMFLCRTPGHTIKIQWPVVETEFEESIPPLAVCDFCISHNTVYCVTYEGLLYSASYDIDQLSLCGTPVPGKQYLECQLDFTVIPGLVRVTGVYPESGSDSHVICVSRLPYEVGNHPKLDSYSAESPTKLVAFELENEGKCPLRIPVRIDSEYMRAKFGGNWGCEGENLKITVPAWFGIESLFVFCELLNVQKKDSHLVVASADPMIIFETVLLADFFMIDPIRSSCLQYFLEKSTWEEKLSAVMYLHDLCDGGLFGQITARLFIHMDSIFSCRSLLSVSVAIRNRISRKFCSELEASDKGNFSMFVLDWVDDIAGCVEREDGLGSIGNVSEGYARNPSFSDEIEIKPIDVMNDVFNRSIVDETNENGTSNMGNGVFEIELPIETKESESERQKKRKGKRKGVPLTEFLIEEEKRKETALNTKKQSPWKLIHLEEKAGKEELDPGCDSDSILTIEKPTNSKGESRISGVRGLRDNLNIVADLSSSFRVNGRGKLSQKEYKKKQKEEKLKLLDAKVQSPPQAPWAVSPKNNEAVTAPCFENILKEEVKKNAPSHRQSGILSNGVGTEGAKASLFEYVVKSRTSKTVPLGEQFAKVWSPPAKECSNIPMIDEKDQTGSFTEIQRAQELEACAREASRKKRMDCILIEERGLEYIKAHYKEIMDSGEEDISFSFIPCPPSLLKDSNSPHGKKSLKKPNRNASCG